MPEYDRTTFHGKPTDYRTAVMARTAEKALAWIQPTAKDDLPEDERADVEDLVAELKSQLARRPELPGLGVCLALQDRGPGPFGIVGWASIDAVASAADRKAMVEKVHSDGRKWKDATDLTPAPVRCKQPPRDWRGDQGRRRCVQCHRRRLVELESRMCMECVRWWADVQQAAERNAGR